MLVAFFDLKFNDLIIPRAKFWCLSLFFALCAPPRKSDIPAFFSSIKKQNCKLGFSDPFLCHTNNLCWLPIICLHHLEHLIISNTYWAHMSYILGKVCYMNFSFNPHNPTITWVLSFADDKMYFKSSILFLSLLCYFSQVLYVCQLFSVLHSAVISLFIFNAVTISLSLFSYQLSYCAVLFH